ncbi:MAG: hypothetical protein NVSMB65_01040 [Chloroflexota bacterium]
METPADAIDPYQVLGVAAGATERDLRRAYHRLSLKWHPDHHMQSGPAAIARAEAEFKRVNHAYVLACQAVQIRRPPTPAQVRQRTRQEEQLDTVARTCTSARLMMIAQYWGLNPYTYRREVEVARQILADAVVFGTRAFPAGLDRALPSILIEQSLAAEEAHMRELLAEAMQIIIDRAPDDEVAAWEAIFAPLGYRRPAPAPKARQPVRPAPHRPDPGARPPAGQGAAVTPRPAGHPPRSGRAARAAGVAAIGLLAAVLAALVAPGLLPPVAIVALAAAAVLGALLLYLIP